MAKVKIKGLQAVEKNILDTFDKVRKGKALRLELGTFVVKRIQAEARRAKPLNNSRTFPALKDVTRLIREALSSINNTHVTFKANRSNLTFSGQLIDAISFVIARNASIFIFVENTKRKLIRDRDDTFDIDSQAHNKRKAKETKTNRAVDRDLRRRGFKLYTAKGIEKEPRVSKRMNAITKKYIRRAIKANFGT
jgi:hypothetical protein